MALELRQPINGTDLYVRFTFKNGTEDSDFMPYPMFGRKDGDFDIPLSTFNLAMRVSSGLRTLPHIVRLLTGLLFFLFLSHTLSPTRFPGAMHATPPSLGAATCSLKLR